MSPVRARRGAVPVDARAPKLCDPELCDPELCDPELRAVDFRGGPGVVP